MHGVIHAPDAGGTTLVAEPESAQTACADANGNDTAGLTTLTFLARKPGTTDRVPIVLAAGQGEDIDQSGRYLLSLRIGEEAATIEVDVDARPRRVRKRRRRRRRRN